MTFTPVESSWIRAEIVRQILETFKASQPLYKDMMAVADSINRAAGDDVAEDLGKVMHAAIRCASAKELQTIRRVFSLMGNQPVNFYDLRERVSVESTAFRPVDAKEIRLNGFRVFCSLLSLDCIAEEHRPFVQSIIDRRDIFDEEILGLIERGEAQGGFEKADAIRFVEKCVDLFTRPENALVSIDEYQQLQKINKVAAQVLVSNALAFNHLTPSVASVPKAHEEMQKRGIDTIPVWQGPVGKNFILRQTSCLAPATKLKFPNGDGTFTVAEHQETFVEFEERQQALTRKGRLLFEEMYAKGKQRLKVDEKAAAFETHYYETMQSALDSFPDDLFELWRKELAYFEFELADPKAKVKANSFEEAIESGVIRLIPQMYEDFFGPAATNIFNSNIGLEDVANVGIAKSDSLVEFETRLGSEVVDMYDYYDAIETTSRNSVMEQLQSFEP
jgi:uncharacterized glyoxalase superfamily metalloenzyme YdcJ